MSIISIIFPLLFLVSLGYGLTHAKVFNKEQIGGLSKFAFYISIPAFLFLNMLKADLSRSLDIDAMLSFYLPVVTVFGLGFIINTRLVQYWGRTVKPITHHIPIGVIKHKLQQPKQPQQLSDVKRNSSITASAIYGLGCSYSNTVLVGLPIIVAAFGAEMMGLVFVIITFHSALLFALTFLIASLSDQKSENKGKGERGCEDESNSNRKIGFNWQQFLKSIVLNPVVLSITLGIIANAINLELGNELTAGLSLLSEPALACALFVLGANLSFYRIRQGWQLAVVASLFKLMLLPSLVYLLGYFVFSLDSQILAVIVLLSASPLGVNSYLIATQLKAHQATLGSTVVLSTVLCVPIFSFWLWWLV